MTDYELSRIIESIIPKWQRAEFLFLESTPRWAPSVQLELTRMMSTSNTEITADNFGDHSAVHCVSCDTTRSVFEHIRHGRCDGVVLIVKDQMRDALLFLGRLTQLCRISPPVLTVILPEAQSLIPLLLDAVSTGVISQPVQDTTIAQWCRRIVTVHR